MNGRTRARWALSVLGVRLATWPAAAHGTGPAGGHPGWLRWAAIAALVVGLAVLAAGLSVDRRTDGRSAVADACVVGGVALSLAAMAVFRV